VILATTEVWTPDGWFRACDLKPGGKLLSWTGTRWFSNEIKKVRHGESRTIYSLMSFDGVAPRILRCTVDQMIHYRGRKTMKPCDLIAGAMVTISEGAHVFRGEITMIERVQNVSAEPTYGFDLKRSPHNFLAGGFLCR
jgi:hypothetical protein